MRIKALIVDDEYKLIEVLKIKLNQHCPQVKVVGETQSVDEAKSFIEKNKIDLLFLDVALSGETGFDLLRKIKEIDFEIIFITGFSEFALDALRMSAVDYILKPIENEELIIAISKAVERIANRKIIDNVSVLKHNLENIGNSKAKIAIPGTESHKFIKIENIVRFEGWDKYTKVHTTIGEVIISSYNIGFFKRLVDNFDFFQTHRSHLVNEEHIEEFNSDGTLLMSNGDLVPVARRTREKFLDRFIRSK